MAIRFVERKPERREAAEPEPAAPPAPEPAPLQGDARPRRRRKPAPAPENDAGPAPEPAPQASATDDMEPAILAPSAEPLLPGLDTRPRQPRRRRNRMMGFG